MLYATTRHNEISMTLCLCRICRSSIYVSVTRQIVPTIIDNGTKLHEKTTRQSCNDRNPPTCPILDKQYVLGTEKGVAVVAYNERGHSVPIQQIPPDMDGNLFLDEEDEHVTLLW